MLAGASKSLIREMGLKGRIPKDPTSLKSLGEATIDRLGKPALAGKVSSPGIAVDPSALAKQLEPHVAELGECLALLHREKGKADVTLLAKKRAIEEFDATFLGVTKALESLFFLAGKDELAKRIRPRKRGRRFLIDESSAAQESEVESSNPGSGS